MPYFDICMNYANDILNDKTVNCIDYSKLRDLVLPNGVWSKNTEKGIELCAGFKNGDLSKPYMFSLNDDNPHGFMGGSTGGGKSVTLNTLINLACDSFSPSELQIIMIDAKSVEAEAYAHPHKMPHMPFVATTKDVGYMQSLFGYLDDMRKYRETIFGELNIKNLKEYRRLLKNGIIEEKNKQGHNYPSSLPRILLIIDEFQELMANGRKELYSQYIISYAKLGRASGMHMLLTSQSVNGALSDDTMSQIGARITLPCKTKDVSKEILGNDGGVFIGRGSCLINTESDKSDKSKNVACRVPFLDTPELLNNVKSLEQKAYSKYGELPFQAFFKEDKVIDINDTESEIKGLLYYINHIRGMRDNNAILLGEKCIISLNEIPLYMTVKPTDCENIMCASTSEEQLNNIFLTTLLNTSAKRDIENHVIYTDSYLSLNKENFNELYSSHDELIKPKFYRTNSFKDTLDAIKALLNSKVKPKKKEKSHGDLSGLQALMAKFEVSNDDLDTDDNNSNDTDELIIDREDTNKWQYIYIVRPEKCKDFDDAVSDNLVKMLDSLSTSKVCVVFVMSTSRKILKLAPYFNHSLIGKFDDDIASYGSFRVKEYIELNSKDNIAMYIDKMNNRITKFKVYSNNLCKQREEVHLELMM